MSNMNLSKAVKFYSDRIKSDKVTIDNFVTTDNLLPNKLGITKATNLPPKGSSMPAYKKNNILIGNIRPYLKKIWFANRDGGCSADVLVLDVNKYFDAKFIYYTLFRDDFFEHMMRGSKGTKMPRGDKNQILDFHIPDFNFETQQKIATVLSCLDSKIELNNRINAELEAMAKTVYDYWFVQFDFPNSEGKPYRTEGGKMVWSDELKREIPEEWEVKSLKEIANTGSGGTPLSSKNEYYENGNIPWINSGELNNPYILHTKNYITDEGLSNSSAKMFPAKTLLVALYGATAGKVSLLLIPACSNQAVCAILTKDKIYTTYLKFAFTDLYKYLINLSSGSARDNLSQDLINDLKFIIPNKSLLTSFDSIVTPIVEKISININENQQLTQLRDWLLPMLMNGQVRVE